MILALAFLGGLLVGISIAWFFLSALIRYLAKHQGLKIEWDYVNDKISIEYSEK